MSERFKILHISGQRKEDTGWGVYDHSCIVKCITGFTKSQAEQVKQALDEAVKEK